MKKKEILKKFLFLVILIHINLSCIFTFYIAMNLIGSLYICIIIPTWIYFLMPLIAIFLFVSIIYSFIVCFHYFFYKIMNLKQYKVDIE